MMPAQRRPRLSPEFIAASRRRRFALATAELAHEFGVHAVTVALICQMAHTARSTFYDQFGSVNDCLRHGIREGFEHLFAHLGEAGGEEGEWLLEVERAIAALYGAAAAEPLLAELLLVHSFGAPLEPADPNFDSGVSALAALLGEGRSEGSAAAGPMPLAEDYLARVILSLAALKLRQEEAQSLPAKTREMTMLVGTAYLGIEQTTHILAASELSS